MIAPDETVEALALLQLPGVGPATARKVISHAKNTSLQLAAAELLPACTELAWKEALQEAQDIIVRSRNLDVRAIGITSSLYPSRLKSISDPPVVIYVKGHVDALSKDGIAVVGTRNVSTSGTRIARTVARYLAKRGYSVVSGLALGVDAAAHEGALAEKALTVAVLAHGLDTISPTSHRSLAERIIQNGGALMSEHPIGFPARPQEFVRRNRLQSGLSLGSIIVESGVEGGSIHQARFTRNQGRHLMTVLAHSEADKGDLNESGAREIIAKMGAVPIRSTSDLGRELERLKSQSGHTPEPLQGELF